MNQLATYIKSLPKAELHLHIEGSLEPELMFTLAEKNHIKLPYKDAEELRKAYAFSDLQSFLDIYFQGACVLQTAEDFYALAMAYFELAKADGIVHAEIFFDPQTHTERGINLAIVMDGLTAACRDAKTKLGITSGLILCFLRHLSEEDCFKTFQQALPFKNQLVAFGLDSSEKGHPPTKFKRLFDSLRQEGFKVVAHAGEEGPADYIWQALNELQVSRIDHGVRCLEDAKLVDYLIEKQIPLTVCPLSNIKLRVYDTMKDHPLHRMLKLGLNVSVHSDDPAYFGGYLGDNLIAVSQEFDLSQAEIKQLCDNSLRSCFVPVHH